MADDRHHPYTYAADLIRMKAGYHDDGSSTKLSRADASQIRQLFAEILDIPDEELAKKLAEYYRVHEEELSTRSTAAFLETLKVEIGTKILKKDTIDVSGFRSDTGRIDEKNYDKTFSKKHACTCGGNCQGKV